MSPKELLQSLITNVERESQFEDKEIRVSMKNDEKGNASATVCINVEGKTRVVEINARDLGVFKGIAV